MAITVRPNVRPSLPMASALRRCLNRNSSLYLSRAVAFPRLSPPPLRLAVSVRSFSTTNEEGGECFSKSQSQRQGGEDTVVEKKPSICTADELHYVSLGNSDWRVALWRYHPSPQGQPRNHPLLLLSGVGTNAIGYDLSPESSFARYMSGQGFDTWILEVRGAGLSMHGSHPNEIEQSAHEISEKMQAAVGNATDGVFPAAQQSTNVNSATAESEVSVTNEYLAGIATVWDKSKLVTTFTETFIRLSERLSGFLSEGQSKIISTKLFDRISRLFEASFVAEPFNEIRGKLLSLLEARQNNAVASQIAELSQKLVNAIEEGQISVSSPLFDLHQRLTSTLEDFQDQLDMMLKYDWDFDHYLEEDVPAAMEYIKAQTQPKDGKLLAIGHSMGGILLYAMLSRCCSEGRESGLAAIVTLASSVDYTSSKSSLKLLIPLAEPAQALNVPAVPLGVLLTAAYPFTSSPPYVLSWLNHMISAKDMMSPDLLKKLVLNNFCTIPAKLLLQLRTAFSERGLRDRSGTFFYKDHLPKLNVPVLALAGNGDSICPPEAVHETVKFIPENLVTYKVFGEPEGPHYAHYDLVGGRMAVEEIYPCVTQFLNHHDAICN